MLSTLVRTLTLLFAAILPAAPLLAYGDGQQSQSFVAAGAGISIPMANTAITLHKISWVILGAPASCTVALDSSADGITWTPGGVIAAQTCTSPGTTAIVSVAANFIRINATALSAGATLAVTWNGWITNPGAAGTGIFVDAHSPAFTIGTAGDMCKAINNAIASLAGTSAIVDASAFTGLRGCLTNPFHGQNVSVQLKLGASTNIIMAVTWHTPAVTHRITGALAGNIAQTGGTTLTASGPGCGALAGVTFVGSPTFICTFTDPDGNIMSVPQLSAANGAPGEGLSFSATFRIQHGPLVAATYYPIIWAGGQGTVEQGGNNSDGDAWTYEFLKLEMDGNTNVIALYSTNNQERTVLLNSRIGFQCGTGTIAPVGCVAVMGDRVEWSTGTVTTGSTQRSGSTRMSIEHFNFAGEMAQDCATCFGLVFEGAPIVVNITGVVGCALPPTAYINTSLAGGMFTVASPSGQFTIANNGGSGCTTNGDTHCSLTGPPTTYGGTLDTTATCTVAVSAGVVTGINVTVAGSGYPNSQLTGGPMLRDVNCAGTTGAGRPQDCLWDEGTVATEVTHLHTINMLGATGYAIEHGLVAATQGGTFLDFDASVGGALHLGYGHDNGGSYQSFYAFSSNLVLDDKNAVTLTSAAFGRTISFYYPASHIDLPTGTGCPQVVAPAVFAGIISLSCGSTTGYTINAPAAVTVLGTWQSNSVTKFQIANNGLISLYGSTATAGLGLSPIIASTVFTSLVNTAKTNVTLFTAPATATYIVQLTVYCTGGNQAAATVTPTITYTDDGGTAETAVASPAAATCTAVGTNSLTSINAVIRVQTGTNVAFNTVLANAPTYSLTIQGYRATNN